jgi:hypothetical protein
VMIYLTHDVSGLSIIMPRQVPAMLDVSQLGSSFTHICDKPPVGFPQLLLRKLRDRTAAIWRCVRS